MFGEGTLLASRYRVGSLLGRGGMADVYFGTDESAGTPVAVKVLRHVAPEHARRFASEASTLARLSHPAIVRYCDTGEQEGTPYLVLEFVDGPTLADVLRGGPLGVERSCALGAHLAEALAHAHHLGIVHRDVKPANVLLDGTGYPRLADFGIARLVDATSFTATGTMVGTASYLAPEQVEGEGVGPAADIYSLGLVLLECSTGRRAYEGTPTEVAMARLVRDPEIPVELPEWWRQLVRDMTALGPDVRPSARQVQERLEQAGGHADPTIELRTGGPDDTRVQPVPPAATETLLLDRPGRVVTSELEVPPVRPREPRRLSPAALLVAVVAVVGLLLLLGSLAGGGDGDGSPSPSVTPALDDALDELERAVRG